MKGGHTFSPLITRVRAFEIDVMTGCGQLIKDYIAVDETLSIYVNDRRIVNLQASPDLRKQLALGYLITEGFINSIDEVEEVRTEDSTVYVKLAAAYTPTEETSKKVIPIVDTASSVTKPDLVKILNISKIPLASRTKLNIAKIIYMVRNFGKKSKLYRKTHGTHSAAIFTFNGKLVSFAEDVSRHNAVDKVIGDASLKRADFEHCVLLSSGRQPVDMVLKAARSRIPIVVSFAHPLNSGIIAAEKTGITLVYVSRKRIIVYTNTKRLKFQPTFFKGKTKQKA